MCARLYGNTIHRDEVEHHQTFQMKSLVSNADNNLMEWKAICRLFVVFFLVFPFRLIHSTIKCNALRNSLKDFRKILVIHEEAIHLKLSIKILQFQKRNLTKIKGLLEFIFSSLIFKDS